MRAVDLAERACRLSSLPTRVLVVESGQRSTRLGASVVLNSSEVRQVAVTVTVLVDGSEGQASTNRVDDEGLRSCLAQAREAAAARPPAGEVTLLAPSEAGTPTAEPSWDEATAEGDLDAEGAAVSEALDAARSQGATLAGLLLRRWEHRAVANTEGLLRADRRTVAQATYVASAGVGGGYREGVSDRESRLQHRRLALEAARVADASKEPIDAEPGEYDVVLSARAVISLLEWLALIGFGSRVFEDGSSFLAGREGQAITGPSIQLWDPGPEDALPVGFDDEGMARRRVDFVRSGRAGGPVYDRASAARAGCTATGHSSEGGLFPTAGGLCGAVHMAPGDCEDLLAGVERGLYVERFHYVNGLLDPRRARMTGLTRDGLFEIRDGRRGPALTDLRFTEDILDALSRADALSSVVDAAPVGVRGLGTMSAPAIRVRGFRFTGAAARARS